MRRRKYVMKKNQFSLIKIMEKVLTAILATILVFAPVTFDRDFYVANARRGIDLNDTNVIIITQNVTTGGSQAGIIGIPGNFAPSYAQIQEQIARMQSLTQNLYRNFGK